MKVPVDVRNTRLKAVGLSVKRNVKMVNSGSKPRPRIIYSERPS